MCEWSRPYRGWNGQLVHPGSSAGLGGPGNFRGARFLGASDDLELMFEDRHPWSPGPFQCLLGVGVWAAPTPLSMAQVRTDLSANEGRINHLYLDTQGLITVGVGTMLPNVAAAQALSFVVRATQATATAKEIETDYKAVLAKTAGQLAASYRASTLLDMTETQIDTLLDAEITTRLAHLRAQFKAFDTYPLGARRALIDMEFNLGMGSAEKNTGLLAFKTMKAAIEASDWKKAAASCHRKGPSETRNNWTRDLFLESAP